MKKMLVVVMAMAFAVVLAGCSSAATQSAASSSAGDASASSATSAGDSASAEAESGEAVVESEGLSIDVEPITGGWEVNGDFDASNMTAEQVETFEAANASMADANYEPIAVVAEQVVAGMNYLYLCKDASTGAGEPAILAFAEVYKDLDGKASVTTVSGIDVGSIATVDKAPEAGLDGGWTILDAPKSVSMSEDASAAATKALGSYAGIDAHPIALLGTQVVAGMNYKFLCVGTPTTPDAANALYVATVYQDLSGNCEVTDMELVDLVSYLGE